MSLSIESIKYCNFSQSKYLNFKSRPKIDKKIVKPTVDILTISTATAASAIAGIVIAEKNGKNKLYEISDEFITTLGKEMKRHRINKENIYEVVEHFEYAPGFISTLFFSKDSNNKSRNLSTNDIEDIMVSYYEEPELVESLITEKNKKGNFKYNNKEISALVFIKKNLPELYELAKSNPLKVLLLAKKCDESGTPLYTAQEIKDYLYVEKKGTEYEKYLLKMKDRKTSSFRFNPSEARAIIKKYRKYPDYFTKIINEKIFSKYYMYSPETITKAASLINDKNIDIARELLNAKLIKKRFKPSYIPQEKINILLEAHSKSLYELCRNIMIFGDNYNEWTIKVLNAFNIKSIPQDIVSKLKDESKKQFYNNLKALKIYEKMSDK